MATGIAAEKAHDNHPISTGVGDWNHCNWTLEFIERHRLLVLSCPLWLAGIALVLRSVSPEFRAVLEFMTTSPLR